MKQYIGFYALIYLLTLMILPLMSQEEPIILSNFDENKLQVAGFTLRTDKSISIEAIGAGGDRVIRRNRDGNIDPQYMFAYAWILDARSRELKWRMTVNNTESDWWDKHNRLFKGDVNLPSGDYELYYSAFKPTASSTRRIAGLSPKMLRVNSISRAATRCMRFFLDWKKLATIPSKSRRWSILC